MQATPDARSRGSNEACVPTTPSRVVACPWVGRPGAAGANEQGRTVVDTGSSSGTLYDCAGATGG